MSIERDPQIRFHEEGTLKSVTRWIRSHDEGLAEWLKNVRRAYQRDRADVADEDRAALLLLRDSTDHSPPRIGLLDVGGATLEDVDKWSTWQDPQVSSRGSIVIEEETQGNGGKAYMYRMFSGSTQILGVKDGRLNRKGMEGKPGSLERGTPGFIPDGQHGRDLEISSWESELKAVLEPYDIRLEELPSELLHALRHRQAFSLVEGIDPTEVYQGRIIADDLIHGLLRHDQSTLAIQQLRLYAMHNGKVLCDGKPLSLEPIAPFPGFEQPVVVEIPQELEDESGRGHSTTQNGKKSVGRLILHTSRDNMWRRYKELKARWKVSYRAGLNMIGSKSVAELVPSTPGSQFVYASVELDALEDYTDLGRGRPNDGPLMRALDLFIGEHIRELARQINDQRRQDLDETQLDEVQEENRKLDNFKNQFLPDADTRGGDGPNPGEGEGEGPGGPPPPPPPPPEYDTDVVDIETAWPSDRPLRIGKDVSLRLGSTIHPRAIGPRGFTVPRVRFSWSTNDRHIIEFTEDGLAVARGKGRTTIVIKANGCPKHLEIPVEVWHVDHVLLTPRNLRIEQGKRKQIVAEITNDEGARATDVLLNWKHDADDQLIVRISPSGWVTGNRVGTTRATAGAGEVTSGGVWARIHAEIEVVPNEQEIQQGSGFPSLLLTGRDVDPGTGEIRPGDREAPALWQEVSDFQNNVWWLNLEHPAALYHFGQRDERPDLWRSFHAQKVVEMVLQVHMKAEYTQKGNERPELWVGHKATLDRIEPQLADMMWDKLKSYVANGEGLD